MRILDSHKNKMDMNRVIKIQDFNNRATSKISNLKDRGILNLIRDFKIDLFYQKKKNLCKMMLKQGQIIFLNMNPRVAHIQYKMKRRSL